MYKKKIVEILEKYRGALRLSSIRKNCGVRTSEQKQRLYRELKSLEEKGIIKLERDCYGRRQARILVSLVDYKPEHASRWQVLYRKTYSKP